MMNFAQYIASLGIVCYLIPYVVGRTETPIMSKKYIGDNDTFTMKCNASSFFNPSIYDWYNVTKYKMYRKLDSSNKEELIGVLLNVNPKWTKPLIPIIPFGRKWQFTYGRLHTYNMYITLTVKDASKADAGYYWCEAEIYGTEDLYNTSWFNLRPLGEEPVQIINKKEIGNWDVFIMKCNNTSFRDVDLPRSNVVSRLMMFRQLDGKEEEEYLGMLESFLPQGYDNIAKKIPDGRKWDYSAGGYKNIPNRDSIFLTLTVKDATCRDAGYYWCAIHLTRTSYRYCSPKFHLQSKETHVLKMNPIKVMPRKGGSHNTSFNVVGDSVTMECTFTAGESMTSTWSYKTIDNTQDYDVQFFDPLPIVGKDGCSAYLYKSMKHVQLDRYLDEAVFFCRAFHDSGEDTGVFVSMKVYLSDVDMAKSKNPKPYQATAINIGASTVVIFLWAVLVICENICRYILP